MAQPLIGLSVNFALNMQREKFRVEIRKNKIENFLNGKRFADLPLDFEKENQKLHALQENIPSLEVFFSLSM